MVGNRTALVLCLFLYFMAGVWLVSSQGRIEAQTSESEEAVWKLERAYWHYVQDNDLSAYANLWHKNFLGWPSVSETPARKDHITDWITSQTAKGLAFKADEFRPASIQATGEIVVACYWMTYEWKDKDGKGEARTIRVIHTWLKDGKDWRIIGGMSMPIPAPPPK
jgi:ketosteroid isomerase-like protein